MIKALETALENFEIYGKQKDVLDKPAYLYDLIQSLVSFSFGPANPKEFWTKIEKFMIENIKDVADSSFEQLVFLFS